MKTRLQCLLAALCLTPGLVRAEFKIDWWSVGGPAGLSTGGVWRVSGAPGVGGGTAIGGTYALKGGFWSVIGTVPTPGAPRLTIERVGSNARVWWPRSAEGFSLQETSTLTGSPGIPWTPNGDARQTNATQISITIPLPAGIRYFRLQKQ